MSHVEFKNFFIFFFIVYLQISDLPDKQVNTWVYLYLNDRKCYLTFVLNLIIYKTMYIMNITFGLLHNGLCRTEKKDF